MQLLDGKKAAEVIYQELTDEVSYRVKKNKKIPHLAAILVGSNGASLTYVNAKVKTCEKVGFKSTLVKLPETITEEKLLRQVEKLNQNPDIDGFIVQLPLPEHINEKKITLAINPDKDVDGFHPENLGKMVLNIPSFLPATPFGIIRLLEHYGVDTSGKHCVVLGRSHIVGSPVSILMARNAWPGNATVTLAHSRTKNIEELCKSADIIIAAIGIPNFLKAEMVQEGAVVIDVGITRVIDESKQSGFRLVGDVDFENVSPKCSFITPVPGGVGPMTIAGLMLNTLKACAFKESY
ncbi:MAG: bifunctional 5,10-methylenetetrahydrofolate dehydrogenase/5,10-methenyltetrahydrofolate cyclohydrolase [Luteibaculaceae bacterium]